MAKQGKKVTANLKMRVPAGGATPAPPVGSTLGQYGVNTQDFINPFNEQTADLRGQGDVTVHVTIYEDRSFDFRVVGIPVDELIRKELGIQKGSGVPQKDKVGKLTDAQLTKIAESKMKDLNCDTVESAKKVVAGTARSMGVEVEK
ncbi:TPA: 50S ribosomal protein L11 [Candidatus Saccharibacteria bacterium]|nr:50S ribosomal protein L11 [Candidatus Saccharibacteria bacterium]HIO87358.1 50S ribosomal protein L11 [Candidatus Saccharibacteria bacterium]